MPGERTVAASDGTRFESQDRGLLYEWVEQVPVGQEYRQLERAARGLVRRYIEKMTGLRRAQVTWLIARHAASGRVEVTAYRRRRRFPQTYTRADIELLAQVDEAHETLSGLAARRIPFHRDREDQAMRPNSFVSSTAGRRRPRARSAAQAVELRIAHPSRSVAPGTSQPAPHLSTSRYCRFNPTTPAPT